MAYKTRGTEQMVRDSTNTTILTTSDQHATTSAALHTTPATTVKVVVEHKTPIWTVQIWCPTCNATKDINMDTLCQRSNTHRCCTVTCAACNVKRIIGTWCSAHDAQRLPVETWLQTHSYDGKTFLKHKCRPPTATVALFTGRLEAPTNSQQSTSSKRERQDIQDNNTKKQRRDDTTHHWSLHTKPLCLPARKDEIT